MAGRRSLLKTSFEKTAIAVLVVAPTMRRTLTALGALSRQSANHVHRIADGLPKLAITARRPFDAALLIVFRAAAVAAQNGRGDSFGDAHKSINGQKDDCVQLIFATRLSGQHPKGRRNSRNERHPRGVVSESLLAGGTPPRVACLAKSAPRLRRFGFPRHLTR